MTLPIGRGAGSWTAPSRFGASADGQDRPVVAHPLERLRRIRRQMLFGYGPTPPPPCVMAAAPSPGARSGPSSPLGCCRRRPGPEHIHIVVGPGPGVQLRRGPAARSPIGLAPPGARREDRLSAGLHIGAGGGLQSPAPGGAPCPAHRGRRRPLQLQLRCRCRIATPSGLITPGSADSFHRQKMGRHAVGGEGGRPAARRTTRRGPCSATGARRRASPTPRPWRSRG